jgi:hypothetical protein
VMKCKLIHLIKVVGVGGRLAVHIMEAFGRNFGSTCLAAKSAPSVQSHGSTPDNWGIDRAELACPWIDRSGLPPFEPPSPSVRASADTRKRPSASP